MAGRRLSPEEQEIWSRLSKTVRPLRGRRVTAVAPVVPSAQALPVVDMPRGKPKPVPRATPATPAKAPPAKRSPVPMLDDGWERRIANGTLAPEMSVDLHGHTVENAHRRLNQVLATAIAMGVRVLLVVTGNPRPAPANPYEPKNRGAIRAEIGDWLALGGHADAIASVRTAHPRHGGKGALYIILRRRK